MKQPTTHPSRRRFLQQLAGLSAGLYLQPVPAGRLNSPLHMRAIPSSGEVIPAIGMGSWLTFAVEPTDTSTVQQRTKVLETFLAMGGRLVDSSPMYGTSEDVLGHCLKQLNFPRQLFSATKVWTWGWQQGMRQMERSRRKWGIKAFDLMQVHNLLDWETHLPTLRKMKEAGEIRYIGVTTSHGRRHDELENILKTAQLDFVQLTYNILDRKAETRLLPMAQERKVAVIINRPFQGGALFDQLSGKPLPAWAAEIDCSNWAQFFLKYVISHPAVSCAIPATGNPLHMRENMGALTGKLPDHNTRDAMYQYVQKMI